MDEHDLASVLRDAVELAKRDPDLGFDEVRTLWCELPSLGEPG